MVENAGLIQITLFQANQKFLIINYKVHMSV